MGATTVAHDGGARRWRTTVAHDGGHHVGRWVAVGSGGWRCAAVGGGLRQCASSYRKEDGREDGGARR